jgi:hypothetical protein
MKRNTKLVFEPSVEEQARLESLMRETLEEMEELTPTLEAEEVYACA